MSYRPITRWMSANRAAWGGQRLRSWLVRAVALSGPLVVGCAAAIVAARQLPVGEGMAPAVGRALLVMVISTAVVAASDRVFRRLLPLSMLLRLSLVFPDQAPSRFKTALKAGSSRRLSTVAAIARDGRLDADPNLAAEQVLLLIGALGAHDRLTRGHCERVRLYAQMIGEEIGLSTEELQKLQWGALLHDLGKLRVPSEILNKKGKPDADEWAVLQRHPADGEEMIQPLVPFLGEWADAVGGHHERWDGTGYPRRRAAGTISRGAAIVAVADSFETMTAVRSYKKPMSLADARAEVTQCAGAQFSPDVVRAFLSLSLGHLRLAMGPLASLAQIPLLGQVAKLPNAMNSTSTALSGATSTAATVAATALVVTGLSFTPVMDAQDPVEVASALVAATDDTATSPAKREAPAPTTLLGDDPPTTVASAPNTNAGGTPVTTRAAVTGEETSTTSAPTTSAPTTGAPTTSTPTTGSASTTIASSTTVGPTTSAAPPPSIYAPVAVDDQTTARQGTTIHIDVLANDFDIDGDLDPLSVSVIAGPTGPAADPGSLSIKTRNGRNEIDYRAPSALGDFTFTYQVCDASGLCRSADVLVTVTI